MKSKITSMQKPYNMLGKDWDSDSRIYLDDYATVAENLVLKTSIQKFEAEHNDPRRWYGIDPGEKAKWRDEEIYKIQIAYYTRCHGKRDEILKELDTIKKRHDSRYKDDAASTIRFKRYEIDAALMDKSDLQGILNNASGIEDPAEKWDIDPDRVRAAAAELIHRGESTEGLGRKALENIHADSRYLCEPGAEDLQELSEFYNTEFGQVRFHKSELCTEGEGCTIAANIINIIN